MFFDCLVHHDQQEEKLWFANIRKRMEIPASIDADHGSVAKQLDELQKAVNALSASSTADDIAAVLQSVCSI